MEPRATGTATPFPVASPTPTPPPPGLWISPALPAEVEAGARLAGEEAGYRIVEAREAADLRLEIDGEQPVGAWIYAVAVPFPTVKDGIAWSEFLDVWRGSPGSDLFAAQDSVEALAASYGGGGGVTATPADELLDAVWGEENALALVPFGELEKRWKVLRVEGLSPLEEGFDPGRYPLSVEYGLSGDPATVSAAAGELQLPVTNRDPSRMTSVVMSGVTALTRATAWAIERQGIDWAIGEIAPWMAEADIAHISHEVAFTEACPPVNPSRDISRFCGQPGQIEVLERLGTDVIELTGNHVMDYGPQALLYTLDLYEERGWATYGGGRDIGAAAEPATLEHNGHRFAFLGCNEPGPHYAWATAVAPGALPCDLEALKAEISRLRDAGYLPIVTFQWAESYRSWPVPAQAQAFREAAEAGAVVVSGSQAHQPQGMEFHRGAFVHYGLGNLLFDQMWSLETRQEFVDRYIFYGGELIGVELTTWMLEDFARLRPMTSVERAQFLAAIFAASGW